MKRNGPPRKGANPVPKTRPMSPTTGFSMTPSSRHLTASLMNLTSRMGQGNEQPSKYVSVIGVDLTLTSHDLGFLDRLVEAIGWQIP